MLLLEKYFPSTDLSATDWTSLDIVLSAGK